MITLEYGYKFCNHIYSMLHLCLSWYYVCIIVTLCQHHICFSCAPLGVKDVIFEQIVKNFMIALIQDYLHVHYLLYFYFLCIVFYFILFAVFSVLLFFILIIHLLIDTLNIQEPLAFIQLKINKEIQSILHQFIFINMFEINLIHIHY